MCQHCPLQRQCSSSKEPRITRWEDEHLAYEVRQNLRSDPGPMTLHRCTVEYPFSAIKAWMGTSHFLTRGLKKVRGGTALNF